MHDGTVNFHTDRCLFICACLTSRTSCCRATSVPYRDKELRANSLVNGSFLKKKKKEQSLGPICDSMNISGVYTL